MSKGSGSQTQTTKQEPWAGQSPYLTDIFQQAQNLTPQQFYAGQTYASPSDLTYTAEQLGEAQALGGQTDIANALVPGFTSLMADPSARFADPMLQQALQAGIRPIQEGMQLGLQQARRGATEAGQLGGSRQGILEAEVLKDYLTKSSDVAAKLYGNVYGDALKSQAVAMQNIPTIMSGLQAPAQTLQQLGNLQTARAQLPIDEAMNRFNFNQNANLANLQNYANLIGSPIAGTQTVTQPGAKSNLLMGILGAGAGAMTGNPQAAMAGWSIGNQM
jgi:hypothetical protein